MGRCGRVQLGVATRPARPQRQQTGQPPRIVAHPWTKRAAYEAIAARGDIIMQIKMLHGIKQRAEHHNAQSEPGAGSQSHDNRDTA